MNWKVVFTKQAQKDARKLAVAGLRPKAEELLAMQDEAARTLKGLITRIERDLTRR